MRGCLGAETAFRTEKGPPDATRAPRQQVPQHQQVPAAPCYMMAARMLLALLLLAALLPDTSGEALTHPTARGPAARAAAAKVAAKASALPAEGWEICGFLLAVMDDGAR